MIADTIKPVLADAPKLKGDWRGRRVIALRQLVTAKITVPAGRYGRIEFHSMGNTTLRFDPCGCCGIEARVQVKNGHGTAFAFVADEPLL